MLVRDKGMGDGNVALKLLENSAVFGARTVDRFQREIQILREFDHPHIVQAFDFVSLGGPYCYTMEYVDAPDLARVIESRELRYDEIDLIFVQLLDALSQLHARRIYHRDIKLENVLYLKGYGIKLTDFGLVKDSFSGGLTQTGILLGTAQYFPPEYIRGGRYDATSELYVVGLMLYEILTRTRRLQEMSGPEAIRHLIETNFEVPSDLPPEIPAKYRDILGSALSVSREERISSAAQMKALFLGEPIDGRGSIGFAPEAEEAEASGAARFRLIASLLLDPLCIFLQLIFLFMLTASLLRCWFLYFV